MPTSGEIIEVVDIYGIDWPKKPDDIKFLSSQEREKLYGKFSYSPDPKNPGFINVKGVKNFGISSVIVPQLVGVKGAPKSGRVFVNSKIVDNILSLFKEWEETGLMQYVLTFDGAFVPRFIRGSTSVLSNHAWGTAFDCNAQWNPLGKRGPVVGEKGSVRLLVEAAVRHGFYWGGWFSSRPDAQHFEMAAPIQPSVSSDSDDSSK